jgi:histidine triad (HIT) family protein
VTDCLFCKIARAEIDAEVVYRSERVVAFRDINPVSPTHVLVIPTEHISSASELGRSHGELLAETFEVMAKIAEDEGVGRGHRIVTNVGPDAGQSVQHMHFHLIGGRRMEWPPG